MDKTTKTIEEEVTELIEENQDSKEGEAIEEKLTVAEEEEAVQDNLDKDFVEGKDKLEDIDEKELKDYGL